MERTLTECRGWVDNARQANDRQSFICPSLSSLAFSVDPSQCAAKAYVTIAIRLRYDYDTTTTKN